MPSPILYLLGDAGVTPSGGIRLATDIEAIAQDVDHLLFDLGTTAGPLTVSRQGKIRTALVDLLSTHPRVTSIDRIDFNSPTPGLNALGLAIHVNGDPNALPLTIS
jgi:hypothetical protein